MEPGNGTQISAFHFKGLAEDLHLKPFMFEHFLLMYLTTVLGNLLNILSVISDSHLHTPMYCFLSYVSFVGTMMRKILVNLQSQNNVAVMVYEHYVVICHPLQYTVIRKPWLCGLLVLVPWIIIALNSFLYRLIMSSLIFCVVFEIPNFFCKVNHEFTLSSDIILNNLMKSIATLLLGVDDLIGILYTRSIFLHTCNSLSSGEK
ncbi:PREDICTED: putative olfactory receptor 7A2 [Chinchilla lanigera]|uniref:putative olfactory receptor 7A2 n=1 Tax=Chinchilla lanigera TaxID=34839 RepID=UPI000695BD3A|nr:PREDICTED: putative olfactory receptor 7A2 [Chinchilla lanigera]XP_013365616.1 PREDICTED: putative olfactory receptor 7A2 [Chinchilla lanigera]